MKKHTEDCLDANDDTSVLKGKCICGCGAPEYVPTNKQVESLKKIMGVIPMKETKQKHTPTPWMVFTAGYFRSICTDAPSGQRKRIVKDLSAGDAAFIVQAVNSYEDRDNLLRKLARGACLDQVLDGRCICFSCEARRLIGSTEALS